MLLAMRRNDDKGVTASEHDSTTVNRELRDFTKLREPLTEGELFEQVIELANTGSVRAYLSLSLGVRLSESWLATLATGIEAQAKPQCEKERAYLREVLPYIAALQAGKGAGVTRSTRDLWVRHMEGMAFIPTIGPNDAGPPGRRDLPVLRYEVREHFADPPMAPTAYKLVQLLMNPSDLCCCQWCGKFFPVTRPEQDYKGGKKGRDIRLYCEPEHRREAEKKQAQERSKRYRENVKERARAKQSKRRR